MNNRHFFHVIAVGAASAMVTALAVMAVATPASAGDCDRYGKPSYTATRTVDISGQKITSKVFVSGANEREDIDDGQRPVVRILQADKLVTFDHASKSGVILPLPAPPPKPNKSMPNTRMNETTVNGNNVSEIQSRDAKGNWSTVIRIVCRNDGVVLEKTFPIDVGGKRGQAKLTQDSIELKELPAATFEVPAGYKIQQPN